MRGVRRPTWSSPINLLLDDKGGVGVVAAVFFLFPPLENETIPQSSCLLRNVKRDFPLSDTGKNLYFITRQGDYSGLKFSKFN